MVGLRLPVGTNPGPVESALTPVSWPNRLNGVRVRQRERHCLGVERVMRILLRSLNVLDLAGEPITPPSRLASERSSRLQPSDGWPYQAGLATPGQSQGSG